VETYVRALRQKENLSHRTYNHYLQSINAFCNWCVTTDRLLHNPLKSLERLNPETHVRHPRRALTPDEVRRLVDAARQLCVKRLVIGECGHAWRAAQAFMDTLNGPLDFLQSPCPQHICELAARSIREGRLKLNKSANDGITVTYHDPCNLARAGGLTEEPREILRAVVSDFREMAADTIREKTYCCGAGGGLLTDELMEVRMKGAKPRAEAFRATGAGYLVTPCAVCKAQFPVVFEHYGIKAQVVGAMDLLGKAIVI